MRPEARRLLFGALCIIISLRLFVFAVNHFRSTPTFLDRPSGLTGKTETIDLTYINWACDCANFLETRYYDQNPDYMARGEDCIFIEPASPDLELPEHFYTGTYFEKNLRLTGQFYKTEGIPKTYKQKTPEKPQRAKVFFYEKMELIQK